jgi:hypothetical protein
LPAHVLIAKNSFNRWRNFWGLAGLALIGPWQLSASADEASDSKSVTVAAHPRLYCTAADLPRLRSLRREGTHARIWKNIEESAEWCLTRTPRKAWIAPVKPDPIYENLYDRFYAIMADLAITEHLAFAYALSGETRYGDAARDWVLASCRAWKREADDEPNGAKAYAVCRLLKGLAVGYDLAFDRFSPEAKEEVRGTLVAIGQKYFDGYFSTPTISGEGFHTHHAVVEWGSLGVAALALRGETPQADTWLAATTKKFEDHLLPLGLAPDGAQVEGATFWASTMHYRLFFMDALRRVTGKDLFKSHARHMNADLALAAIATHRSAGYDQDHANTVLEPSYGQLDYYAPVLLFLAREYRRGIYQHLALWDETLGQIQKTRYLTPHGEPLLFGLGGYAFVWLDPTIAADPSETKLSYHFPSVDEAYLRRSWQRDDLVVGVRKGEVVVHGGGIPLLIEPMAGRDSSTMRVQSLDDANATATVRCADASGQSSVEITFNRPGRSVTIRRRAPGDCSWWCHGTPTRDRDRLTWPQGAQLKVITGHIDSLVSDGYGPLLATGFLKLELADPAPMKFPLITIKPAADGQAVIEVTVSK